MNNKILFCAVAALMSFFVRESFAADDYIACTYTASTGPNGSAPASGSIQLYSWSWGASNPSDVGTGSGTSAGRVSLSDFSIGLGSDATKLLQVAVQGALSSVSCGFYNTEPSSAGGVPSPYLTVMLTNAVLSSVEVMNTGKGDKQRMKLWFNIDSIIWR